MLYVLMFGHWVGDFVCQNNWMALGKSKRLLPLAVHVAVYSLVLALFAFCVADWRAVPLFTVVNAACHFLIDFCTSKLSSYFWKHEEMHAFFVTVGFDQYLHFVTIAFTASYFL